jgi:hypothetical protein
VANAGGLVTIDGRTTITENQAGNSYTRSLLADGRRPLSSPRAVYSTPRFQMACR